MKHFLIFFTSLLLLSCSLFVPALGLAKDNKPLKIGFSISITNINAQSMREAKAAGISSIEIGTGALVDQERKLLFNDQELLEMMSGVRKATSEAGIEIWSIHMPFGQLIDLSLRNENEREKVVNLHEKLFTFIAIIEPKIILFHPSWHLGLNEREARKQQLVKSVLELNESVLRMGATMVIENMLGPELLLNDKMERPLNRTVEETMDIMNLLPRSIYGAVDMNHIKNPQALILALGSRLKTIHVADGDGLEERHYLPCSGKGENDWEAILTALAEVNYSGPFMFESKYEDITDFKKCYEMLYLAYTNKQTP